MPSESERLALWNDIFSPEAEGVRITPGPGARQLTIDYIDDHCVQGIVVERDSYFDGVLHNALNWLYDRNNRLRQENVELKGQIAKLQQKIFGVSSEQSSRAAEAPATDPPLNDHVPNSNVIDLPKARANRGAGRKPLSADLPRRIKTYDASSCPCCHGSSLHPIGEEATEQLIVIPARFEVLRRLFGKYRCKDCEKVFTAQGPKHLIEKSSYASPEFLAYVACNKYQFGLPFYRQEAIFNQQHLPINRTTLSNLMNGLGDKLPAVLAAYREELLQQDAIHADETNIQVLKEPGRKATKKSWLWLYRSLEGASHPIVLFEYQQTRAREHLRRFLDIDGTRPFKGRLHADAYVGYKMSEIIRHACWAHARRKFTDILKSLPTQACNTPAQHAIELIGKLYGVERRTKGLPDRIRHKARQEESVPILDELKAWLDDMHSKVTPDGSLGKAIAYALDNWPELIRYVEDGRWAIDNNIAEREIKAVVIGRKNWLFADSVDGAHTNAIMYSLVQTAKANGIDPFEYLRYVFETMPTLKTAAEVHLLLPWNMPKRSADRMAA